MVIVALEFSIITVVVMCFIAGYCLVGWQLTNSQKCYKYFGGIATYEEAEALCALEKSTIAQPYNQFWVDIGEVVKSTQQVLVCVSFSQIE